MAPNDVDLLGDQTSPGSCATGPWSFARFALGGYELSSHGDRRFSALHARLRDGRLIESAYQLDVKGYRAISDHWKAGKGKPPIDTSVDVWAEYLKLWKQWASENPDAIADLERCASGRTLTDKFARTPVSQARALAVILNERFAARLAK